MILSPDSTLRGEVAGKLACPLRDLHVTVPATLPAAEFSGEASAVCKGLMHGWRNRKADALGEPRKQFALHTRYLLVRHRIHIDNLVQRVAFE